MNTEIYAYIKTKALGSGLSNIFFNGVIAYLLLKDITQLEWWGQHSFVVDILATAFILPFIVTWIVVPMQRKKARTDAALTLALDTGKPLQNFVAALPQSLWLSATVFGLISLVTFSPLTLLPFHLFSIEAVAPLHYAIFKGLWAGSIAAIMVVPMIMLGLRQQTVEQSA